MAKKHMKKWSLSLVRTKMQSKTTLTFYLIPFRYHQKHKGKQMFARMWRKETSCTAGGNES
jgi:hypothetical protein